MGHEYRQAQSTNKVRVCTTMIYSPWYVDGTHMWLGAIYIPCRQSFTPVCFEFDEWAKLAASYSSLMKIENQVKER
jgi:hypothetical protein